VPSLQPETPEEVGHGVCVVESEPHDVGGHFNDGDLCCIAHCACRGCALGDLLNVGRGESVTEQILPQANDVHCEKQMRRHVELTFSRVWWQSL
jgi:hypothetical protein